MVSALKFWLRYILALCAIAVIAYMIACSILVTLLVVNSGIGIRMIRGNKEKRSGR